MIFKFGHRQGVFFKILRQHCQLNCDGTFEKKEWKFSRETNASVQSFRMVKVTWSAQASAL
jgi:hypothetical protein